MIDDISAIAATKGRVLSVDFGDVRTGLAVSDEGRILASGIGTIKGGLDKTLEAVAKEASDRGVVAIIVGLPVNMDGSLGFRAERAQKFAGMLKEKTGLPVAMTDERLTTMAASRYLNATDTRGSKRKGVIDTLSAEIILQNSLDKLKG